MALPRTSTACGIPLLLLLLFLLNFARAQMPPEWQQAADESDILFSPDDSPSVVPLNLQATIGNGFLATQLRSTSLFIAGVFNGEATTDPSHRARIPPPHNIDIQVADPNFRVSTVAAGLFLRAAYYERRLHVTSGLCQGCLVAEISQRWYAHRSLHNLLVMELNITFFGAQQHDHSLPLLALLLNNTNGGPSNDIDAVNLAPPSDLAHSCADIVSLPSPITCSVPLDTAITIAETKTPEIQGGGVFTIAWAGDTVPTTISVNKSMQVQFVTSYASSSWGIPDPLAAAVASLRKARSDRSALLSSHTQQWAAEWQQGSVRVAGNKRLSRAINSSLYYLMSSSSPDLPLSLSPGGLASNGYNGHTFWDCESWMFPPLLALHPSTALQLLQYRFDRLDGAMLKAVSYNASYQGAMFPWESAASGEETCPAWAGTGLREVHISSDIALAVELMWEATGNIGWLSSTGFPIVSQVAEMWCSRVQTSVEDDFLHINGVIPPDEYADHKNDSVYTNWAAVRSLRFAAAAADVLRDTSFNTSRWIDVSNRISLLYDAGADYHPEYLNYKGHTVKQADIVLLPFPLLMPMNLSTRLNDLKFYENRTDAEGPAMTWAMFAIGHWDIGDIAAAQALFNRSYANVQEPFGVWTETPSGGTTNFLTGAGGFLQAVINGLGGVRLSSASSGRESSLTFQPQCTSNLSASSGAINGVYFRGWRITFEWKTASSLTGTSTSFSTVVGIKSPIIPGEASPALAISFQGKMLELEEAKPYSFDDCPPLTVMLA